METQVFAEKLLGDIVADDIRTAAVFQKAGIDFCCGGRKTLEQACLETGTPMERIIGELSELKFTEAGAGNDYNEWPLDFLADYIVNTHHQYVKKTLPGLLEFTQKIARVHGEHHPELQEVATLFGQVSDELTAHLQKEENVLFPAIRAVWKEPQHQAGGVLRPAITRMVSEHEFAGGALDRINELTGGYRVPEDGCQTYQATMTLLEQFENDLHIHVHLENNILFPKALKL